MSWMLDNHVWMTETNPFRRRNFYALLRKVCIQAASSHVSGGTCDDLEMTFEFQCLTPWNGCDTDEEEDEIEMSVGELRRTTVFQFQKMLVDRKFTTRHTNIWIVFKRKGLHVHTYSAFLANHFDQ